MTDPENDNDLRDDGRETRTQLTSEPSGFSHDGGDDPIGETIDSASVTNPDNRPEREEEELPAAIGRYRIESMLGKGGFGSVYLAFDDELQRNVTIKVPHTHRIKSSKDVNAFLTEARTLAKLEHPNVVPVHDVGTTPEGQCFIVSRYIDGSDLVGRMRTSPLSIGESVELVATIAEALHYVHHQGVIHRDIKPSNILLDKRGTAYLADFGLALLEDDGIGSKAVAGTPAYMSPEQARGENHLVKATSDIFSLGVVLYQLLAGRRPFVAEPGQSVTQLIQEQEASPLRDLNRDVPAEIERICMKALSKRATARHQTALDFSEDLRHFLAHGENLDLISSTLIPHEQGRSGERSRSSRRALGIVPRGLRSFGPQDAHFFMGLLPGPYDRDGTPESILFWKRRIEERDPENSFRIGLIYGPSGCGKSSFVKAGLVPTLSSDVIPVVIEAAPDATETRLLNRLRRSCPYLDTELGLPESIATLRRGHVMGQGKKVLLVIDQFEQWLYSVEQPEHSVLAKALRQCDGEHVQCILMVRDDFWLAFSRFMDHLEVDLMQNKNMALIDLFDPQHARRVLTEFGRAFGRLPEHSAELSRDARSFVAQAIEGLAEHGKITPVRLALFAEMVKNKPWTTATLRKIGGTAGVGVMFLDENFSSENAPASYRIHLNAVYATLGALLPQPGTNLKGHMRSREELLELSGYSDQPKQFQSLMRALDTELHLITRTDPEGRGDLSVSRSGIHSDLQSGNRSGVQSGSLSQSVYYHLAHDYLVPAIRDWQARMQRGTRKGRAEIRLAQRTEVWDARPDSRHLPTLPEWVSILAFTRRDHWDDAQQRMMKSATRRHVSGIAIASMFLLLVGWGVLQYSSWNRAKALTGQLAIAKVGEVSGLLDQLEGRERWTTDRLIDIQQASQPGSPTHLFASLALLRSGSDELENIKPALLRSDPETLALLCQELRRHGSRLAGHLWERAEDESVAPKSDEKGRLVSPRFNAALVLANFDPPGQTPASRNRWNAVADPFADELIHFANIDRRYFRSMVDLIRPATPVLVGPLAEVMTDPDGEETELRRSAAQNLLINLLEDDVPELTHQLLHADVAQILFSIDLIDKHRNAVRPLLNAAVAKQLDLRDPDWKRDAKRKATAAAILLRHGASNSDIWSTFQPDQMPTEGLAKTLESDDWVRSELQRLLAAKEYEALGSADREELISRYRQITFGRTAIPNARTRLVQRIRAFGVDPDPIAQRLLVESDVPTQCGLMQALGEYPREQVNADLRDRVITLAQGWFTTASDARLRANSLWFLRQWKEADWVRGRLYLVKPEQPSKRNWYVNSEGHTMIQLPPHEPEDSYRIEVAMAEVTLGQMRRSMPDGVESRGWKAPSDDAAVGSVTYHDAVAYCNWLSRETGLQEDQLCYPDRTDDSIEPVLLYPDYKQRTGYRLPMAEEWFFMCTGGAITDYSFGSCEQPSYLLSTDRISEGYSPAKPTDGNGSWAVGLARPNGFGIFDTYSNVREWTSDIDQGNATRLQVCGFDYRFHLGMSGVQPRYLGWSQPHSQPSFYGLRVFRSRPTAAE
ncbi:Serine/threonine-protein kinase PknB [Stieleria neptunia]|uniref:Serine/threonine-protein kinase PknB n=1 Tax=Stieleria neptunia TaxID=2527979 RepID=A0A518HWC0_9BACT|nr:bifunctional serine/threonine-protein kinase/formylglycine-generating enzyme family protein [Stieleria neptunia]QDV45146.1 Serine/threonine-protein kinase PknB [Stieleria neptunia]